MNGPAAPTPLEALGLLASDQVEPSVRWTALPWSARILDMLSSYLPLLLMGLMALGSWWLVKNAPSDDAPRAAPPPRHEADYTMRQFAIQRFTADGPLRARIEGQALRHFPDTDTFEIDRPSVRAYTLDGSVTVASAVRALSNADATEVQLLGDAQVTREPTAADEGLSFRGDFLHAFLKTERLRSHLPAVVTRGGTIIRAAAFDYDNLDRTVNMTGGVRATFAAPGMRVRGPAAPAPAP